MLQKSESYETLRSRFSWAIPDFYNIGVDICDKWSGDSTRSALVHEKHDGSVTRFTFADIRRVSNQAANLFVSRGLVARDRVGVLLPQAPETGIAHVAAYKAGAIVVPLFTLFGLDALRYRLKDAGIRFLVTDTRSARKIDQIRADVPDLETVFCIDAPAQGCEASSENARPTCR